MIDRYHLRYFLAVIDQGNFSRAAIACNVTQPTLSVGIAKLEQALGRTLFRRTNRRVELTEAGARLAASARRIEAGFAEAERAVAGSEPAETLRFGVLATIPVCWIEAAVSRQSGRDKPTRIEIVEGREGELRDRLMRGRLDAALTIVRDSESTSGEILFTEGYALVMGADHPLAGERAIAAEALVNEPMIVRRHCEVLAETSRHFTARGVRPFFPARTTSDERALGYVRAGLGLTVMPECFVGAGIVRPQLRDFGFTRTIGIVLAPHADPAIRTSPFVASLIEVIEHARDG